jgi:DNA repair protein RadA/Sms
VAKKKSVYVCGECGAQAATWQGQCPRCRQWNTLAERQAAPARSASAPRAAVRAPQPLSRVEPPDYTGGPSRSTGLTALDELLGPGLVPGAALLLGGEPGIGKSTILLQIAGLVAASGRSVLYVSGEESLEQLAGRARRLDATSDELLALASTETAEIRSALAANPAPELVVVDSIQTMRAEGAEGAAGSVAQVRAAASELIEAVKATQATLILVGHVTKEGQIAGPKLLEHMVDTVLYLEGDRRHMFRILRVLKNRFGPTSDLMVMTMAERGLEVVEDAATFFLGERDENLPGAAVCMAMDGQRPFAVEVQALAAETHLGIPRRTALGLDAGRLNLMLAVMEKHLRLNLGQYDVYVKLGGGLKMIDPGLDLAMAAAVLSSFYEKPAPAGAVFWGEIDLNGRIRPVANRETRRKQATRLGHKPILQPKTDASAPGVGTLAELCELIFW